MGSTDTNTSAKSNRDTNKSAKSNRDAAKVLTSSRHIHHRLRDSNPSESVPTTVSAANDISTGPTATDSLISLPVLPTNTMLLKDIQSSKPTPTKAVLT